MLVKIFWLIFFALVHGRYGPRMLKKKNKIKVQDLELRSVKTGAIIARGAVIDNGKTVDNAETQGKVTSQLFSKIDVLVHINVLVVSGRPIEPRGPGPSRFVDTWSHRRYN